jgi:hypothetical protein
MRWLPSTNLSELLARARRLPPVIWAGVAVNAVLVFLPFYDPTDDTFFLSFVATFSNHAPVLTQVPFPGGFFELALWVPAYLAYVGSGYDLYSVYTSLKFVYFVLALLSAWLLYGVGRRGNPATGQRLAAFVLLNPALLFVSYIWVNWDAFPIFFVLLGYVLLRYGSPGGSDSVRIFLSALALMVAVFFYWYPLALFPTFLLYGRTTRERILFVGFSVVIFAALMAVNVLLFTGSLGQYFLDLAGASSSFHTKPFFGLPFYTGSLSLSEYLPILLGVTIVLPTILRWRGVAEAVALFCVASLFVWTSPVQEPDNFTWIFWFVPLMMLGAARLRLAWPTYLGLSALPIVGVLIVAATITNGEADGQGFFFWGYSIFHWGLVYLPTVAGRARVLVVGNALLLVALVTTVGIAIWGGTRRSDKNLSRETSPAISPEPPAASRAPLPRPSGWTLRRGVGLVVAVGILVSAGLLFNATVPALVHYDGSGVAPLWDLGPAYFNNTNVPRPLANDTFAAQGPNLTIYATSPPMVFALGLPYQTLSLNSSINVSGIVPQSALLLNSSTFDFSPLILDTVNAGGATTLSPTVDNGTQTGTLGYPLMRVTSNFIRLGAGSTLNFAENSSTLTGTYQYLSFEFHRAGGTAVPIFELSTPGGTVDFVSHPGYEELLYASSTDPSMVESVTNGYGEISGQWNYAAFRALPTEFWFDFDGVVETFSDPGLAAGNGTLRIGQSSLTSFGIPSMTGLVTPIVTTTGKPAPVTQYYLTVSGPAVPAGLEYLPINSSQLRYDWHSSSTGTRVVVDGISFSSPAPTTGFEMGKFTAGNYTVSIVLDELSIGARLSDRYYLVPVFLVVVLPYAAAVWLCGRLRTPRG